MAEVWLFTPIKQVKALKSLLFTIFGTKSGDVFEYIFYHEKHTKKVIPTFDLA